ncbi:MAG: UDP-N-acetylmuramoyl-L-alanine--D-glutamate ligase [bacterium]
MGQFSTEVLTLGQSFLVLGVGRAGRAVSRFLIQSGAEVYGWDDNERIWYEPPVKKLSESGLKKWQDQIVDRVIVSPGVREEHPVLQLFRRRGVPIVDELDFASHFLPGAVIAVTGTNGKSTTAALIGAMLQSDKKSFFLGGNIAPGKPLSVALVMAPKDYYCVEVSSFQLERSKYLAPKIAVMLNVSPDHLDRHLTFKRYVEAKARIFQRQKEDDWAVLNYDDSTVRVLKKSGLSKKLFFSSLKAINGAFLSRGWMWFKGERVLPARALKIPGRHNVENALAAICVARLLGISLKAIRSALIGFNGLEHRLEAVKTVRGVLYVNNSMCTNPKAGVRSIEAFSQKVILIAGGKDKGASENEYLKVIRNRAKWVVLLGENSARLAHGLAELGFRRQEIAQSMREAVRMAAAKARKGDVVLFSPGFASFDMFRDFQERGKVFKNEVRKLA